MSWDTNACFKSLCAAYNEFIQNACEQNIQDLQRQIDVLIGITTHGGSFNSFSTKEIIYTESLSVLVSLINTPNLNIAVYVKSLMALSQLANNNETRFSLQKKFNLGTSLVTFILRNYDSSNNQLKLQSLSLMQKMTYKNKIFVPGIYVSDLISHLVKIIHTSKSSDHVLAALAVVANICHHNKNMQSCLKSMDDVKLLYKKLFQLLSHSDLSYSITSLSLLTSLVLNEEMGMKVFYGKNLTNIIQLIFNTLVTKEDSMCCQYAADLLMDLMACDRISRVIAETDVFITYIQKILNLIHSTDPQTTAKIFELLILFCGKECTSSKILEIFIDQCNDEETQLQSLTSSQAVLHWIVQPSAQNDDVTGHSSLLSIVFVREIISLAVHNGLSDKLSSYANYLFSVLLEHLILNDEKLNDEKILKHKCDRLARIIEVIIYLCEDEKYKVTVANSVCSEKVTQLVFKVYELYSEELRLLRNPSYVCSQELSFLVVRSLELLSKIKHAVLSGVEKYASLLQDQRLHSFLGHALLSNSKYLVHAGLQILAEGFKSRDFQTKMVGEILVNYNQSREDLLKSHQFEEEVSTQPIFVPPIPALSDITNKGNHSQSASVAIITEHLKKGLEIKDSKLSDIMEFYEQKLTFLAGRETHLEDLLNAKTLALTQSDRLIAQYRCRQAQSEAECLKLRTMLQQSEKVIEKDTIKIEQFTKSKQDSDIKINTLLEEIQQLRLTVTEHENLKADFNDLSQKVNALEKSLLAADAENHSLAAMNDCLLKNNESLKVKIECSSDRIKIMEEEYLKISDSVKEKENKINEMKKHINQVEVQITEKQREVDEYLGRISHYEKELRVREKTLKEMKYQVSSLESVCVQHEQTIKDREETISQMQEDLEKQTQIAAMIHNLTSGKINVAKSIPKL
ncbi:protein CIP2A homolog L isoform X2 [Hydra vulgaris]